MTKVKSVAACFAVICFLAVPTYHLGDDTKETEGGICQTILNTKCNSCHYLSRVCQKIGQKNKRSWKRTLKLMAKKGAKLKGEKKVIISKEEKAALLDCLVNNSVGAQAACK
jgi:hypothetical protein